MQSKQQAQAILTCRTKFHYSLFVKYNSMNCMHLEFPFFEKNNYQIEDDNATLIYLFQLGTLTIGDKTNGEAKDMLTDTTSSKSTNSSQGGGGKSIKAMWKRFAFKATKGQTAGSLPTSVSIVCICRACAV